VSHLRSSERLTLILCAGAVSGPRNTIVKVFDSKFRPKQVRDLNLPMTPVAAARPNPAVEEAMGLHEVEQQLVAA